LEAQKTPNKQNNLKQKEKKDIMLSDSETLRVAKAAWYKWNRA
jgi:hypothetical protein